jgi:heterotetrameric sarcosine oxidase gamma subunit
MSVSAPEPRSVLADVLQPGRYGAAGAEPLKISERRVSIIELLAKKGQEAALEQVVSTAFVITLPKLGWVDVVGPLAAIWIRPGAWLVTEPWGQEGYLARRFTIACFGAAAVVDQTHAKTVLRISGPPARDVLTKGCRVDLHPRAFGPGRAAATPIANIDCVLLQVDNAPTFDLLLPSTFAQACFEWLAKSAAEFGYEIL